MNLSLYILYLCNFWFQYLYMSMDQYLHGLFLLANDPAPEVRKLVSFSLYRVNSPPYSCIWSIFFLQCYLFIGDFRNHLQLVHVNYTHHEYRAFIMWKGSRGYIFLLNFHILDLIYFRVLSSLKWICCLIVFLVHVNYAHHEYGAFIMWKGSREYIFLLNFHILDLI